MKLSTVLLAVLTLPLVNALSLGGYNKKLISVLQEPKTRGLLQDVVTWDKDSLFIRGERILMFSGEFHPFRLPVSSLYLDIFQKIRALGFNMVSFYIDWALLEGKPGEFRAEGIFDLEPFFDAAKAAGIYLLARPGPYINAEVSGGGFPGWLQRITGVLRTDAGDFLRTTDNYMANICAIIAKHQITRGGPIILFQPKNEYSYGYKIPFPNDITIMATDNEQGHDSCYPLGFDCANPTNWPPNRFLTNFYQLHMRQSPGIPFSLVEFQGGSFDPWGEYGLEQCSALINHKFERVYYKNNIASGVKIFNIYMIFGGTNWGNLGHPGGYTSYDYGACIRENGAIDREKYAELKLEAEFLRVSPGYLLASPGNTSRGIYSDSRDITITPLLANGTGNFFVVRHSDYAYTGSKAYRLRLPTSAGTLAIPQMGGALVLPGRDSRILVTDYPVGEHILLYSTAEVFTWKKFANKTVLILYGGANETHEFASSGNRDQSTRLEGCGLLQESLHGQTMIFKWTALPKRQVMRIKDLMVYLVDRNSAYRHWVPVLTKDGSAYGSSGMNPESVIVNGGYLIRSARVDGSTLALQADFNTSTTLEIIGVPPGVSQLTVNGRRLQHTESLLGDWTAATDIEMANFTLPDLSTLQWYRVDSLPEVRPGYDDSQWPLTDHTTSNNMAAPLKTPVSLYGSDYGFHAGTLLFRGHFTARGSETRLWLRTAGGSGFASSVWLDDGFLGSFKNAGGASVSAENNATYTLSQRLQPGSVHVLTVVVNTTGLDENTNSGFDAMKTPRGILDYALLADEDGGISKSSNNRGSSGTTTTPVSPWKITGNLTGEDYVDKFRGPLNEGGLFFERHGLHLPSPPLGRNEGAWLAPGSLSPLDGLNGAGIVFYAARLPLALPSGTHDIPLSFVFGKDGSNASAAARSSDFRALLFVNGFQYRRYASNIGPQADFPVPQGILDHSDDNWIGLALWALDASGANVPVFRLTAGSPVLTGRDKVQTVHGPPYHRRPEAY